MTPGSRSPQPRSGPAAATPRVTLIAAMDADRLIGRADGGLPWATIERDRRHFRSYCAGKALLFGRRTFEEMGRSWFAATGARPIALTRDANWQPPIAGTPVVGDLRSALAVAGSWGEAELVVCGGSSTYQLALPLADRLVLTLIDAGDGRPGGGGLYFPEWDADDFVQTRRDAFPANADDPPLTILWLERKNHSELRPARAE